MLEVNTLSKVYPSGKGIFNLNFKVEKGEAFGYLGPNGAGKTTTIRHLLGFINPDQGNCSINGLNCRSEAYKIQKILGYLPGEIAFFDEMTGTQFLDFIGDLRKMKEKKLRNELIDRFEIETDGKIRKMSKGMKQKVGLIAAFMHDPEVLILDEPTSGLDPLMQNRFIELINEQKKLGKTILMSSHNFDEVERTCDRVGIINQGKLITVESITTLKTNQRKAYIVTFENTSDVEQLMESQFETIRINNNTVKLIISNNYNDMFKQLSKHNIIGLDIASQNLEQIFMQYYGKEQK